MDITPMADFATALDRFYEVRNSARSLGLTLIRGADHACGAARLLHCALDEMQRGLEEDAGRLGDADPAQAEAMAEVMQILLQCNLDLTRAAMHAFEDGIGRLTG